MFLGVIAKLRPFARTDISGGGELTGGEICNPFSGVVLASIPYPHQRCAIEAWHIRSQPLPMNREAALLPPVYNGLINKPS